MRSPEPMRRGSMRSPEPRRRGSVKSPDPMRRGSMRSPEPIRRGSVVPPMSLARKKGAFALDQVFVGLGGVGGRGVTFSLFIFSKYSFLFFKPSSIFFYRNLVLILKFLWTLTPLLSISSPTSSFLENMKKKSFIPTIPLPLLSILRIFLERKQGREGWGERGVGIWSMRLCCLWKLLLF